MKIYTKNQLKTWDEYTMVTHGISSTELMMSASEAFVNTFLKKFDGDENLVVFAGIGNNGGDGIVIGKLLGDKGFKVRIYLCNPSQHKYSADNLYYQDTFRNGIDITEVQNASDIVISSTDVVIDALFGYGFEGSMRPEWIPFIEKINTSSLIYAVDIPSGIETHPNSKKVAVRAHYTISFECPKLPFFLPEYEANVGDWEIAKIPLDHSYQAKEETPYFYTQIKEVKEKIKMRSTFSHKGNFGHGLLIAGSRGKVGACKLCAHAALRSGIGRITIHAPKVAYSILQTSLPEAMVSCDMSEYYIGSLPDNLDTYDALAIGPGIGTKEKSKYALIQLLHSYKKPLVLDADALNILSEDNQLFHSLPKDSILTPHPGEFDRLFGNHPSTWDRICTARIKAQEFQVIIVLKGAYTAIINKDGNVQFNISGNAGMASAGSGDVLTGILLALLSQHYSSLDAAIVGVFLHGLAGDLALVDESKESLIASDIISHLGDAFKNIQYGAR